MASLLQPDDQLAPGVLYTFSFTASGQIASTAQILADIANNAPSFIGSPAASWGTPTVLNVTFNYAGDGSDVVSDVANELIAAMASEGSYNFTQVALGTAGISAVTPNASGGPTFTPTFANLLPSWLGGASVTPAQQAQYTAQGNAEINSVAANAQMEYGAGSPTAITAVQASETEQTANTGTIAAIANNANQQLKQASLTQLWLILGVGILAVVAFGFGARRTAPA